MQKTEQTSWAGYFYKQNPWAKKVAGLWERTPLFQQIPKSEIVRLATMMHERHYQPEESIFNANDLGAGAALIISGQVEICTNGVTLAILGPGDFFGEISLVLDERRTADVVAVVESELAFFLRLDLDEWTTRVPQHAVTLTKNLARSLAKRLQHANKLVGDRIL